MSRVQFDVRSRAWRSAWLTLALAVMAAFWGPTRRSEAAPDAVAASTRPVVRLGVYDSRAIAVAYANSPIFQQRLQSQMAQVQQAEADGDDIKRKDVKARMQAVQKRLHRQGFGDAPVDDILARIADALPVVAQEAGVDAIASRLAYRRPGVEEVDVTDLLVARFSPPAKALRWIKDLRGKPVVTDEEIDAMGVTE